MPLISPDSADSRAMTTTGCQPPPSAYCPASSPTQPNPAAAAIRRSLSRSGPACGASVAAREPVVPKTPAPSACASSRPPPTSSAAASGIGMVTAKRTTSGHGTGGRLVRTSSSSQAGARSPLSATREACHPVAAERRTPVAHWSRAVVLLRPVTAIAERTAGHRIGAAAAPPPGGWLRRLSGYCLRHRADLYGAFAAALIGSVIAAVVPLLTRAVVDRVVAGSGSGTAVDVTPFVVALVAAGTLRFAAGFTRRYLAGRLSLDVQMDLRNDVAAALSRLDGPGQDRLQTGQVVSRSISDVTLVQGLLAFLPNLTGNALLFVVSLVVMAWLSPVLTVVALAVGPALWWLGLRSRRDLFPANWAAQQQAGVVAGQVEAAVTGVRVVKGFGQEERELARVDDGARRLFGMRMRVVRFTARYNPLLQAVPALGQVGRPGPGRLAGAARLDQPGHLPGLRQLPGRAGLPGAPAGRRPHRRAAGPRGGGAGAGGGRPAAVDRRRRRRPARRAASRRARRRHLRLRARPPGARRGDPAGGAGGDPGAGRHGRLGEVQRGGPAAALLRRRRRRGAHRRARRPRPGHRVAARCDRRGLRGQLPVLRLRPRQHRLRPARRDRRRGARSRPRGAGRRVHRRAARRLRHRGRRAGADPLRRPAAAGRAGPRAADRPAGARPRRRHLRGRRRGGGAHPRGAARGDGRPHHAAGRAPPLHAGAGRPGRGPRRRAGGRRRHGRGAGGALAAVPAAAVGHR